MPTPGQLGRVPGGTLPYLLDALTPRDDDLWLRSGGVPQELATVATFHGVQGWVRQRAAQLGVAVPGVQQEVDGAVARHHRALLDLERASDALRGVGCPFLVVKGPALVALYGDPRLRSYVDLDLLVAPTRLAEAVNALRASGFRLLDANWNLLRRVDVHELRLVAPSGGAVDLHWSLGRGAWSRDRSPRFERFAARSREVVLGPVAARVLGPADAAVHLAVHAAAAGGHRLLWCADLRAALSQNLPRADLVDAALEWGAGPALDLMLLRTRAALGPGAAPDLRADLGLPRLWRRAVVGAERLSPSAATGTSGSLARLLARSCRGTPAGTASAVVGKSVLWLMSGGRASAGEPIDLDPASPGSALHPVGGPAGERAFFEDVAAIDRARRDVFPRRDGRTPSPSRTPTRRGDGVTTAQWLKNRLVESPGSLGERARQRRWDLTRQLFPDLEQMTVIDLGGTVEAWLRAPVRPKHVTVLNIDEPGESDEEWLLPVYGDACDAPRVLARAGAATAYDLVFSNAVLEHVGGHANRVRFADAVRELAGRHWVQTPYRYFPLEPHWLFPGMQFLPVAARVRIAESWPLVHSPHPGREGALREVLWTELVSLAEMRSYFPTSTIHHERVLGLTKSLVAVRA